MNKEITSITSNTCAGAITVKGIQIEFVKMLTGEDRIEHALEKFAIVSINCFLDPIELLDRIFPGRKVYE